MYQQADRRGEGLSVRLASGLVFKCKRVFAIEIEKCEKCGGPARVIANIEDPNVNAKILKHLRLDQASQPHNRSPPETLFDHSPNLF